MIVVGSKKITASELTKDLRFIGASLDLPVKEREKFKEQLLSQAIDQYLILEYGREQDITLSDKELQDNLEAIKRDYTEETFNDALLRGYVDFGEWMDRMRGRLLITKIMKTVTRDIPPPSQEEIREYFELNREEFKSSRMLNFRQVVTRTREEAKSLLKRIKEGADMGELAGEYSIAPEAETGGQVGWVSRGSLCKSMDEALFRMTEGMISSIVETPYGFHVFEVLSVRPEGMRELPEVFEEIESILIGQHREVFLRGWLQELMTHFQVKISRDHLDALEFF